MSEWAEWVEILWVFTKFFFKQILKVSAFYLEKQKSFILKKYSFMPLSISKQKSFVYWPNFQCKVLGEVIYFCDRNSFQNMIVVNNSEINYFSGVLISRTWVVKKTRSSVVDFLAKWLLHFSKCAGESFNFLNYFFTKKARSFWLFTKSCSLTVVKKATCSSI